MASSAQNAIKVEKKFKVAEVFIDDKWVDTPESTGFKPHEKEN